MFSVSPAVATSVHLEGRLSSLVSARSLLKCLVSESNQSIFSQSCREIYGNGANEELRVSAQHTGSSTVYAYGYTEDIDIDSVLISGFERWDLLGRRDGDGEFLFSLVGGVASTNESTRICFTRIPKNSLRALEHEQRYADSISQVQHLQRWRDQLGGYMCTA